MTTINNTYLEEYYLPPLTQPEVPEPETKASILTEGVRTYETGLNRFVGWVLYLFNQSVFVHDGKQTFYLNTKDLLNRLCPEIPEVAQHVEKLAFECFNPIRDLLGFHFVENGADKVRRIALQVLNPIIGGPTTIDDINSVFTKYRASKEEPLKKLETMNESRLTVVNFNDLESRLKPGDIFFKKQPEGADHRVLRWQKFVHPMVPGKVERESYRYTHVAIYVGNGQIAEAVPQDDGSEVRILNLKDSRFALHEGDDKEYLVSRPSDESLGREAAEIAKAIATPIPENQESETPHQYSKLEAALSLFIPSTFGPFARRRYIENYYDFHASRNPIDIAGLKKFFCSNFGGYCFQAAESLRILPDMLGENDAPKAIPLISNYWIARRERARLQYIRHWSEMSDQVQLKYDPLRLSPQGLRNFMAKTPGLFTDMFLAK